MSNITNQQTRLAEKIKEIRTARIEALKNIRSDENPNLKRFSEMIERMRERAKAQAQENKE